LAFPLKKKTEAISLPQPQRGIQTAPSHGVTPPDALLASAERTQVLRDQRSSAMSATA
jgi:hypothetical protein